MAIHPVGQFQTLKNEFFCRKCPHSHSLRFSPLLIYDERSRPSFVPVLLKEIYTLKSLGDYTWIAVHALRSLLSYLRLRRDVNPSPLATNLRAPRFIILHTGCDFPARKEKSTSADGCFFIMRETRVIPGQTSPMHCVMICAGQDSVIVC